MANTPRNIGIDVQPPQGKPRAGEALDPFYGSLSVRGQVIDGVVVSAKMEHSVVVKREYMHYLAKYQRYEKRTSKYTAHLPGSIGEVKPGDRVKIAECRPLSKTKSFVVIEARSGDLPVKGHEAVEVAQAKKVADEGGA